MLEHIDLDSNIQNILIQNIFELFPSLFFGWGFTPLPPALGNQFCMMGTQWLSNLPPPPPKKMVVLLRTFFKNELHVLMTINFELLEVRLTMYSRF